MNARQSTSERPVAAGSQAAPSPTPDWTNLRIRIQIPVPQADGDHGEPDGPTGTPSSGAPEDPGYGHGV